MPFKYPPHPEDKTMNNVDFPLGEKTGSYNIPSI